MHLHMTAAISKYDMKGVLLQISMDILNEIEKVDVVTGLKTKTEAGRPDWKKVRGMEPRERGEDEKGVEERVKV